VKPRSLLVLTLVVAALGAFVWFYERKQPTTDEAKAQEKKVLGGIEADNVSAVTIARDGSTLRLVKEGGAKPAAAEKKETKPDEPPPYAPPADWRMTAPLAARADRTSVDGLLSSLLGLEKARTFEKGDRKEYGLAPPAATVTLETTKGKRVLEVGRELPGTDQRAVAVAGAPQVQVVAATFWNDLVKPAGDWRSKELFGGSREDVERVSIAHGAETVLLARRGGEPWVEAPLADRADAERFDQVLDALTGLNATEFLDTPPSPLLDLGLDPPQGVFEVVRKGQSKPFRLELGATKGEGDAAVRYARADGQLVTINAKPLDEALARSPQDWRSRSWTTFAVYDVDSIVVRDGQGPLTLTRADADWKRGNAKIFYGTVSDMLAAISDAKADRVVDAAEGKTLTVGAPAVTIELVGAGGKKQTLTLWPASGESRAGGGPAAKSSGRDAVLVMAPTLSADLAAKIAAVRKAEPIVEKPTPSPSPKKR
jgi:uncharacterized protein DUF4340